MSFEGTAVGSIIGHYRGYGGLYERPSVCANAAQIATFAVRYQVRASEAMVQVDRQAAKRARPPQSLVPMAGNPDGFILIAAKNLAEVSLDRLRVGWVSVPTEKPLFRGSGRYGYLNRGALSQADRESVSKREKSRDQARTMQRSRELAGVRALEHRAVNSNAKGLSLKISSPLSEATA